MHTWDEIAQAMCQAELVHETIVVLSFLPVAASVWFGAAAVFLVTSLAAAAFDLMFVMMQRYNRGRRAAGNGIGIGLSLSRSIFELQNGNVTARNLPEGGACFEVRLYSH